MFRSSATTITIEGIASLMFRHNFAAIHAGEEDTAAEKRNMHLSLPRRPGRLCGNLQQGVTLSKGGRCTEGRRRTKDPLVSGKPMETARFLSSLLLEEFLFSIPSPTPSPY